MTVTYLGPLPDGETGTAELGVRKYNAAVWPVRRWRRRRLHCWQQRELTEDRKPAL